MKLLPLAAMLFFAGASTGMAGEKLALPSVPGVDITTYGEVRAYVETTTTDNVDAEIKTSSSKIGLNFKTKEPLYVFGEISADVDLSADGTDDVTTRFGYIGVGSKELGEVSIGRTMSLMESYVDKADVFYGAGNQGVQKTPFNMNNSLKYGGNFNGVDVGFQTQMTDDKANHDLDLYQIGLGYKGIGIAYARDEINSSDYYGIGVKHKVGKFGAYASASVLDDDTQANDAVGYEIAGSYDMNEKLTLLGGWQDTDVQSDDGNLTIESQFKIATQSVFFTNIDHDLTTEDTTLRTGLSFTF